MSLKKGYIMLLTMILVTSLGAGVFAYNFAADGVTVRPTAQAGSKVESVKRAKKKASPIKKKGTVVTAGRATSSKVKLAGVSAADLGPVNLTGLKDGVYYGQARGFNGNVRVAVTIKDGKMADISVVSTVDTPSYFERAKRVINRILKSQSVDVDSVSGATISSNAIKVAVRRALAEAQAASGSAPASSENGSAAVEDVSQDERPEPKEIDLVEEPSLRGELADGTFRGQAQGYSRDGDIVVDVTVKDGKIYKIKVVDNREDMEFFAKAISMLPKIEKAGSTEKIDNVTGATLSSKGLKNAVNRALKKSMDAKKSKVEKKLSAIEMENLPPAEYTEGDRLNLENLAVSFKYSDGSRETYEYKDFAKKGIDLNYKDGDVLSKAGRHKLVAKYGGFSHEMAFVVEPKAVAEDGYVAGKVQDYDSPIFVRPPEVGGKLYDGVYVGHGKGYYAEKDTSYTRQIKVQVTVKDGKVAEVRELDFGDDLGGGGIGYKAKAKGYMERIFDLAKGDTSKFIKEHIDVERYMAYVFSGAGSRDHKQKLEGVTLMPGDTEEGKAALRKKLEGIDAVGGATYSKAGYSRAVAEALYKAGKNEKQINDMYLEDYDFDKHIQRGLNDGRFPTINQFYGWRYDKMRAYRVDNNYGQVFYYDGENFDPARFRLNVEYTDGSRDSIPLDKLKDYGFRGTIWYQSLGPEGKSFEEDLSGQAVMKKTNYYIMLKIEKVGGDKKIKSDFVNHKMQVRTQK